MRYDDFKESRRKDLIYQCAFPKQLIEWGMESERKIKKHTDISAGKRIHKNAALLLCLCYIDGISPFLGSTNKATKKTFVDALITHSGKPCFGAMHPKILQKYLKNDDHKGHYKEIFHKINPFLNNLQSENKFFTENEFLKLLAEQAQLSCDDIGLIKEILFHGTYAAFAYKELRCRAVHELEPAFFSFENMTFGGVPIPKLGFEICYEALQNIIENNIEQIVERECNASS